MNSDTKDTKQENLHAGHRNRMREHMYSAGLDSFHPHEVAEILLFSSIPRANTNPIGHLLMQKFGNVKNMLEAKPEELLEVSGIGSASAAYISSIRDSISDDIREQFRQLEGLSIYNLSFLADWFMRDEEKPVGIMLKPLDGAFHDFRCLPILRRENGEIDMWAMLCTIDDEIPCGSCSLFLKRADVLSKDDVFAIRQCTFGMSIVLDEIYLLRGREPVSILADFELVRDE